MLATTEDMLMLQSWRRRAMLFYVLVPCLRLAPAQYCSAKVAEKMPALLAVIKQMADRPQVLPHALV